MRNQILIFLTDGFFAAGDGVQFFEVSSFVGECFCMQLVVVLGGSDILGKNCLILQPLVDVLRVEPVVAAFMLHDFYYSASVDLLYILVVKVLVEDGSVFVVPFLPSQLVLLETVGVGENLFSEAALEVKMLIFHLLVVLFQVCVLYLFQVIIGLFVDSLSGLFEGSLVVVVGEVGGSDYSGLSEVVLEPVSEEEPHVVIIVVIKLNIISVESGIYNLPAQINTEDLHSHEM